MIRDATGREKLAQIAVGAVAFGAGVPAGGVQIALGGWGLIERMRGRRTAEWDAIAVELSDRLSLEWATWRDGPDDCAHAKAAFEDVVESCALERAEIVAARLDAEALAAAMLLKAEAALPAAYADRDPRNAEAHLARTFLLRVARAAFAALLVNRDFMDRLAPDLWRGVLEAVDGLREGQARVEGKLDGLPDAVVGKLLAALDARGEARAARAAGVSEAALIELARRVAADVTDLDQAMRELERAVEVAIRVQAEGAQGSNLGDFVDAVLARVAALSGAGDFDGAAAAAGDAFARWERDEAERRAAAQAQGLRLLEAAMEQDLLRRDPAAAAARIAKRVEIETPDAAGRFGALQAAFNAWWERGRDKGLKVDLAIAAELARVMDSEASNAKQKGAALNNLGTALATLGQIETDTAQLENAAQAYRSALLERLRERCALCWARTQMNLGNALATHGGRETGTERVEQAVEAYRAALEVFRPENVPLDWARTQMNLGNALRSLGERENETARLEQAVEACRVALTVLTPEGAARDWAFTQMNLGSALGALGKREKGTERLEQAISAFRAALGEFTRNGPEIAQATAWMNLANALAHLGRRLNQPLRLEESVIACSAALGVFNRDHHPRDWAQSQEVLGTALEALGHRETGTARLERAVKAYHAALEVLPSDHSPQDWARIQNNLGNALSTLGLRVSGTENLTAAIDAYCGALQHITRQRAPLGWATAHGNRAVAMAALAERTGDAAMAAQAAAQMAEAAEVLRDVGLVAGADEFDRQLPAARALAERLSRR